MRTRVGLTVVIVLTVPMGLAACSDDSAKETTTTTTTGAKVKDFQVSTPDGAVTLSLDGKLPSGWPSSFPTPKGATAAGSGSVSGTDSAVMVGVYSSDQSATEAFDFYTSESSLSPSDQKSIGSSSNFLGSMDIGGKYDGTVTVAAVSGNTYIVVILKTSGSSSGTTSNTATTTTIPGP